MNINAQKMKFSIEDIFSKCDQICSFLRLVIFTELILNGKLIFVQHVLYRTYLGLVICILALHDQLLFLIEIF